MKSPFFLPFFIMIFAGSIAMPAALADEGEKPQLGIYLQELDDAHRKKLDFDGEGVLVLGTVEGTGAAEAGLEKGDVIIAFNGELVDSPEELGEAIANTEPGQKVKVVVFSDGETRKVRVTMGRAKRAPAPVPPAPPPKPDKFMFHYMNIVPFMGVSLQDLPDQLAAYFEVEHGVLLSMIEEDGPADEAGLKAGDVIIRFDGVSVKSSSELYEELYEAKPGDDVELDIVRRGKKKEATITLGKKKIDSPWAKGFFLDKDSKGKFLYRVPPAPDVQKFPRMPDMPDVPEMPELPDIPQLKYRFGLPEGEFLEDMKDFKEEMEDLRDELKELRDEMRALKKEI